MGTIEPSKGETEDLCTDSSEEHKEEDTTAVHTQENEETLGGPKFDPHLYLQRYAKVAQMVAEFEVKKVVDFGCAECTLQKFLRDIESVEEVSSVDIDVEMLQRFKHKIYPQTSDYVFKRTNPLVCKLYEGDVSKFDSRLADYEAVTLVELIEHLHPETLESFPPVVFGKIRPKVVVVTTPNAEFNVLFPGFTGFRHPDHKFELTRAQFQQWCDDVAQQYGYAVTYHGVGDATPGDEHVGHCTQIAKFARTADHKTLCEEESARYNLISEQVFPHKAKVLNTSKEILLEAKYYMHTLVCNINEVEDEDPDESYYVDVRLDKLMVFKRLSKLCDNDQNKLKEVLGNHGYDFSSDGRSVRYLKEVVHSDYSGLTDEDDGCDLDNQDTGQVCSHSNADVGDGDFYIPGQFSDAEDDDSVPCVTFQYGKTTPSSTMWSYPAHSASDDVDWD